MEQPLNNSTSGNFEGRSKTPIVNIPGEEKSEWRIPSGTDAHRPSIYANLFSSSLPVLPHKLNFNESEQSAQSVDDTFPSELRLEDEVKDPLEDTEPNAIGSFLPGDEVELLAGLNDDFDLSGLPTQLEDFEDDFFGSGGGLEIESEPHENLANGITRLSMSDGINGNITANYGFPNGFAIVSSEHPYGEHPSRTLFVRNINSNIEDSELKSLFEQYGDVRTLYTACKHRGFVMISYYDIRAARTAMRTLQNKPLGRRKLDIHFSIPKDNPSEKDINQGTLVVFNLDASVTNDDLCQIFGAYGEVKEIRETPHKRHHKFIEFYDVRAAEAALKALNRTEIAGKCIKLELSRPGGARRSLMQQLSLEHEQDDTRSFIHQVGSPIANSPPGSWSNFGSPVGLNSFHGYSWSPGLRNLSPVGSKSVPGLASILPSQVSNPVKIAPIGKDPGRISHANQVISKAKTAPGTAYQHHYPVLDPSLNSTGPMSSFGDPKSSSVPTLSGPQFLWGSPTIYSESIDSSTWSTSLKGRPFSSSGRGTGYPYPSQHGSFLSSHHHVGSAPSGIQLERHFGFFPESPETSYMNPAAFGARNFGRANGKHAMNMGVPGTMNIDVPFAGYFAETGSPSSRMMSASRNGPTYFRNGYYGGMGATLNDALIGESVRSRRADSGSHIDNKKQYQLYLEKIINGEDARTTLMIKNIPNKYTSKMLMAAIDETHKGTYDFLYLPIDFKNKCNVGYAFINMVSTSHIVSFYEVFNGKKWEKFNSEKVASLAYARIQGKIALISHFQNSSLMNEDKRCRPILFQPEGRGSRDLESLQPSNLNIFIRQPDGSYIGDSLDSPKGYPDDTLTLEKN